MEERRGDAYKELEAKFASKKEQMLLDLKAKLDMPFTGNASRKQGSRSVQDEGLGHKANKVTRRKKEPVQKILRTNQKVVKFVNVENKKLLRILDRIELDKPIMMHDKLDVIWDKDPQNEA